MKIISSRPCASTCWGRGKTAEVKMPKEKKNEKKKELMKKNKKKPETKKSETKKPETMRESAAKLRKDLEEFMVLIESEGSRLPPEELQGFEERQFRHITSQIADAIISRIGEKKFRKTSEKLKSGEITPTKAAADLGIKMGDLVLILEARKVFSEEKLKKLLDSNRKP